MSPDRPPLSPAEAALPVTRGVLRDELATAAGTLRAETAAQTETLRGEMAAQTEMLRAETAAQTEMLRGEMAAQTETLRAETVAQGETLRTEMSSLREDLREEIHASESRTRVLSEETHSMLQIVVERLSDAIGGNAQIARLDTALAGVRNQADAAASLAARVNDHERRIAALEGRS